MLINTFKLYMRWILEAKFENDPESSSGSIESWGTKRNSLIFAVIYWPFDVIVDERTELFSFLLSTKRSYINLLRKASGLFKYIYDFLVNTRHLKSLNEFFFIKGRASATANASSQRRNKKTWKEQVKCFVYLEALKFGICGISTFIPILVFAANFE